MESEQAKTQHAGVCYVFFRLFPGLREPYPFGRYVMLPDEEVNAAMEADAARWLDENRAQVIEILRKKSARITGPYLKSRGATPAPRSSLTFPKIARIAGWTYPECYDSIGIGGRYWATARFPILAVANEREAVAVCDGLNHGFRKNPHPDSPRFGWLDANGFPPCEQLDIEVRIREAQSQSPAIHPLAVQNPAMALPCMIDGEAAPAIHSLAAQAVEFYATLQQSRGVDDATAGSAPTWPQAPGAIPGPMVASPVDPAAANPPQTTTEPPGGTTASGTGKHKRSTGKGEARVKLIAALTKYHQYADGGCLNLEPIGNNELARLADVSKSRTSEFFCNEFNKGNKGGRAKYRVICRDAGRLADSLKALNGEFSPHDLYGRRPSGEDERDDEE